MGPTLAANKQHLHTDLAIVPLDLQTQRNKAEATLFHQPGNLVSLDKRRGRKRKSGRIIRGRDRRRVGGLGGGGMRSCDRRNRTLVSDLTPTVSRKLTGLRSRMMVLGTDGSGSGSILMTATSCCSSLCTAPSCAGVEIAVMKSEEVI